MNNNEVKNVEDKQNNSLMRKTKVQLIEIILRKDSIEKKLRTDIKGIEDILHKYEAKIDTMKDDYSILNKDYTDICDEKASVECELKSTINKQIWIIWLLVIIFVISFCANVLIYFYN